MWMQVPTEAPEREAGSRELPAVTAGTDSGPQHEPCALLTTGPLSRPFYF